MEFFTRLFRPNTSTTSSVASVRLSQAEREAIIDLLLLGMYTDGHLSLAEEAVFDRKVEALGWESAKSLEYYEAEALPRAQAASESEAATSGLLQFVNERLSTATHRAFALDLLEKLLEADGRVPSECAFLKQAREQFRC